MELDLDSKFLQSTHETFLRVLTISLIKGVAPQFFVAVLLAEHVGDDDQHGMPQVDQCSLSPPMNCQTVIVCRRPPKVEPPVMHPVEREEWERLLLACESPGGMRRYHSGHQRAIEHCCGCSMTQE